MEELAYPDLNFDNISFLIGYYLDIENRQKLSRLINIDIKELERFNKIINRLNYLYVVS